MYDNVSIRKNLSQPLFLTRICSFVALSFLAHEFYLSHKILWNECCKNHVSIRLLFIFAKFLQTHATYSKLIAVINPISYIYLCIVLFSFSIRLSQIPSNFAIPFIYFMPYSHLKNYELDNAHIPFYIEVEILFCINSQYNHIFHNTTLNLNSLLPKL